MVSRSPHTACRVTECGIVVRKEFSSIDRHAARAELGIRQGKLLLTVLGGSLGSVEVSEAVLECAPGLLQTFGDLEMHVQVRERTDTSTDNTKELSMREKRSTDVQRRFKTTQFFDNMAQQLAASDLVLSRAGAGTCAELLYTRVPSVLWPLATATDNHQMRNAEWMEKMGVSLIFRTAGGSAAQSLERVLSSIIGDREARELMQKNANAMADSLQDGSACIAHALLEVSELSCA
jgi:UDP-N-acetylglucosamine--N-acetylmuramyl-(pentapeptide) pyrophosphoryl-undecaprenol N-acetylglucosamine transferase